MTDAQREAWLARCMAEHKTSLMRMAYLYLGDEAARAELNACLGERETLEDRYRLISRDSLDWYRAHDDDVMFAMTGELDEIDFDGLMEHCLDQGSDVAQLAREVEKKASMRRLER